jgi:hypothetical protein
MTNGEKGFFTAGQAWLACASDVGQNAVAVIAITRQEWLPQGNASVSPEETDDDRARFAHQLLGLALDAQSSRAARERGIRARSRRRVIRQFAV